MWIKNIADHIIYEDREIIVCHKPAGIAVQNARVGAMDMESGLKNYLAKKKPGKIPYLGVVHRLDQPVEGVLVFAKTSAAAAALSRQMRSGQMGKHYLAVTEKRPQQTAGILEDFLIKDGKTNTSSVAFSDTPGAKKARLCYKLAGERQGKYLLAITLETGRHHQIRVQMAHAGMPLAGDRKYNADAKDGISLGLCAHRLEFRHPGNGKKMQFQVVPQGSAFEGFQSICS